MGKINISFRMMVTSWGKKGRRVLLERAPQWASAVFIMLTFLKLGGEYIDVDSINLYTFV